MSKQSKFLPDAVFARVTAIRPGYLRQQGIRGLVVDIDNTLTEHDSIHLPDDVATWAITMRAAGVRIVLISNNHAPRVSPFADKLGVEWVCDAHKPLKSGMRRAQEALGCEKEVMAMVGDQLFTDVLAARRYGIRALLVEPVAPDFVPFIKLKRRLEAPLLRRYYARGGVRYE